MRVDMERKQVELEGLEEREQQGRDDGGLRQETTCDIRVTLCYITRL